MKKYRIFTSFYKEEDFINNITKQGYRLVKRDWYYFIFEKTDKQYQYKIDFYEYNSKEYHEYLAFLNDFGLTYLNNKNDSWIYIEKEVNQEDFELYTDYTSRLERANRITKNMKIILLSNVIMLFTYYITFYDTIFNAVNIYPIKKGGIIFILLLLIATIILLINTIYQMYQGIAKDSNNTK